MLIAFDNDFFFFDNQIKSNKQLSQKNQTSKLLILVKDAIFTKDFSKISFGYYMKIARLTK